MARYNYRCNKCEEVFEITHSMFDKSSQKCPKCNKKMVKLFSPPTHTIIKEPKTLGSVADKNANEYSKSQKRELDSSHNRQRKERIPQWYDQHCTKDTKEVGKMSPQERRKYVETGK